MRLVEAFAVQDILADGVGRVEILPNGLMRWVLYSERQNEAGEIEYVIVGTVVMAPDMIPESRAQTDHALASMRKNRHAGGAH